MRNGTLPMPEKPEPPIYLATDLWFAFMFIFGMLSALAIGGFYFIDGAHLNNCNDLKASGLWIKACNDVNNTIYTLFIVLGSLVTISTTMYFISKFFDNKVLRALR